LFAGSFYVQREIEYSYISTMGEVNVTALANWEAYLEKWVLRCDVDFNVAGWQLLF
jgi:hypothetical protein